METNLAREKSIISGMHTPAVMYTWKAMESGSTKLGVTPGGGDWIGKFCRPDNVCGVNSAMAEMMTANEN